MLVLVLLMLVLLVVLVLLLPCVKPRGGMYTSGSSRLRNLLAHAWYRKRH